jgi:two-component system, response regulator
VNRIILLVEDDRNDEDLTLRAVRKHIRHVVVVTRDGVEALDFLFGTGDYQGRDLSISPSLVLLDLRLPKLSGFEVLRCVRGDARTCCIPVVIFSSSAEEQDVLDSYNLGANSYICKPEDYDVFCNTLIQVAAYWLSLNKVPMR